MKLAVTEIKRYHLPGIPDEIKEYLSGFNQTIEATIEFGGEPFRFDGDWAPGNLEQLIRNMFAADEGCRIKLTASMMKGLMKIFKELAEQNGEPSTKALAAYLLSLLSMNANLKMKFEDVQDILDNPLF